MNLNEAQKMITAAKANNVELMVGHLLQYHPVFKEIKKYVTEKNWAQYVIFILTD